MFKAKCGHIDENEDQYSGEIVCNIVGCDSCEHGDGNIYVELDIPKAMSIWVKREKEMLGIDEEEI